MGLDDRSPFERKIMKWNNEKPTRLFEKLLHLLATKQEYAVRFADGKGLELGFKYLEKELFELKHRMQEVNEESHLMQQLRIQLNIRQTALSKLCRLLNYISSYRHNKLKISRNKAMITTITTCIFYIMQAFEEYHDSLAVQSFRLAATCVEMNEIRDFIGKNTTYSKQFYQQINAYLLYSPPDINKLQILQYLFDFLDNLFGNQSFVKMSVQLLDPSDSMADPHIYVALFKHLEKYMDYVYSAKMGQDEMMKFEIK